MDPLISTLLHNCQREIYSLVAQYGTACLLGDKTGASTLNKQLNESLEELDSLGFRVAKLESEIQDHSEIMEAIEEDENIE